MNPMMMMMQAMQNGMNPMQWMQQQGGNPQIQQLMQMTQGKSPQELRSIAANMAKQRGLNYGDLEQQIAQRFGFSQPNRPQ